MSNDRNHDEQISAAYKDLAKERTPAHLDENIMRMAKANAARPQYSRWVAWSRPLAWAATVALCLAITLEVTQVTTTDDMATATTSTDVATPSAMRTPELQKDKREQLAEQDMDQNLEMAESLPDPMPDSLTDSMADSISSEKISPARSAAKQLANEPAATGRMRYSADLAEEEIVVESKLAADMPADECSEEARSEPDSWFDCIKELEAAGDEEATVRQRENLKETFPDFKLP